MLLNKIKQSLRIKHNKLDEELNDLISASKCDLALAGVKKIEDDDALIIRAVTLYCKSYFGLQNNESDKYERTYNLLKNHLSLSGDYNV